MYEDLISSYQRLLDPMERTAEVVSGLIMVMTFTVTLGRVGSEDVRTVLFAALGCNTAWGIIDGALHVMSRVSERGTGARRLAAVQQASAPEEAHRIIAAAMPSIVSSVTHPAELELIRQRLMKLPEMPHSPRFRKDDWLSGLLVFLLVFLSTFPVVIPFILMRDAKLALRLSNVIAIALLFLSGCLNGRANGYNPWKTGLFALTLGTILAVIALVLGG